MAWSNENTHLRKVSRPLSIINENPNDVIGHFKGDKDDVITSHLPPREQPSMVTPISSRDKPARRKAVAPLRHPVDFLVPSTGKIENIQTTNACNNNNNIVGTSDTFATHSEMNTLLPGDIRNSSSPDQESISEINNCTDDIHNIDKNASSRHGCDTRKEYQLAHAGTTNIGDDVKENGTNACNSRFVSSFNNSAIHSMTDDTDVRDCDENGNTCTKTLLISKCQISHGSSLTFFNDSHSDRTMETSTNGNSSNDTHFKNMFYLSNSTPSLNGDEESVNVETRDILCKGETENETIPFHKQISHGNNKDSMKVEVVDSEQLAWKNRVKKSRSFIKNSNRPMRRSVSATFGNVLHSDINEKSISENASHSPGSLRRSRSLQLFQPENSLSLQCNGLDKLSSNLYKKCSNLSQFTNPSNAMTNELTVDQSNDEPIRRISSIDQSDFRLLEITANRLHLPTRRPSVMAWKEKYMNDSIPEYSLDKWNDKKQEENVDKLKWTGENIERINASLALLRKELINLRLQDQSLARQFLGLRHTMNSLRLTRQCEDHKDLLDDAEEDIEELRELSKLVDLPPGLLSPLSPLKNLGITRMNLSSRRFSTC